MDDVQKQAGTFTPAGVVGTIMGDPEGRLVWAIVVGAVAVLVVTGRVFRPQG